MKKTTLLSLLTAGAIVATSAGTYAIWDVTTATASGTISVASPKIKLTDGTLDQFTATEEGNAITYSGDASFSVKTGDIQNIASINPSVKIYSDAQHTAEVTGGVEATVLNPSEPVKESMVYKTSVKITSEDLAGDSLYVVVTATAIPK